ncbi:MAG: hypothetical protein SGJ09_08105 [Phycisphaerae bacterium]|mgnify:CR=1 FL=1|nr:hypothetical protein [Phycisphaerae bacterium]
MSVAGARAKTQLALKDLLVKWERVHDHWNDDVARAFQEHTLDPLEGQVRAAASAMDKIRETLYRVKQECADRSS